MNIGLIHENLPRYLEYGGVLIISKGEGRYPGDETTSRIKTGHLTSNPASCI
jgi:hypothetical protein